MGIIMGGTLFRKDLDSAVDKVSEKARMVRVSDTSSEHRLVDQEFDVSKVLQFLPVKSLSSKLVVKRSELSLEKFLKDHYLSGSPVIIGGCMAHWPAKTKWNNMDYLLRVAGDRTVPVEEGNSEDAMGNEAELVKSLNKQRQRAIASAHRGRKPHA